ncbi:MAG: LysR family transcriptional regulator [Candidatus Methanomethylophilaceae archaeon]|nr:LysR family transcriptional regulator [Candidatus Methanomethylophilaceae archaeon]
METNLMKYKALLTIADEGSFTKAAESLSMSQSGISRMISDLEAEWGFRLFDRDRGGTLPTSELVSILPYVRSLCRQFDSVREVVDEINDCRRGHIRVGVFSSVATYWLPRMISRFREDHPDTTYELVLGDYSELEEWVKTGFVDFAFSHHPEDDSLECMFIEDDQYKAVVPSDDPSVGEGVFRAEYLNGRPFILLEKGGRSEVGRYIDEHRLCPDVVFKTWDDYSIMNMVQCGLGIGILPGLILGMMPEGTRAVPLEPPLIRKICIIRRKGRMLPPSSECFLEYVKYRSSI